MERSERESRNVHMKHGDDDETNKAQTWATVWSIMYARNCATDENNTNNKEETLQTNKLSCGSIHSAHESYVHVGFYMLQVCGHI